jgi:hypothetical protein
MQYDTSRLENVSGTPTSKNHKVTCTLLYLKISTKLKIAMNTLVKSSFSRMILKNKHFHGNIFDEAIKIMC